MQYNAVFEGSNSMIYVSLNQGESVKSEAGAMVAKSPGVKVEGKMEGGFGKALFRSLAGEQFFFQTMTAEDGPGEVILAPASLGDVKFLDLSGGKDFFIQGGGFVAGFGEVEIDTKMQKLKQAMFSGEGLFVLHVRGTGAVAVSAFGAIYEVEIPAGKDYIVDNGHLVAWSGDTSYDIEKAAKGWISSITSGEGLVCRFTGPGKVWLQTRNPDSFSR